MKGRDDTDSRTQLQQILSPADAQSLVRPPPDHAPRSGPGESTPLTGNLTAPPSQATPSRSGPDATPREGLARYFAGQETQTGTPGEARAEMDRSRDPQYIKVLSQGQVGYLPRIHLARAQQIDPDLKVLGA